MTAIIKNWKGQIVRYFEGNSKKRIFNKIRENGILRSDEYILVVNNGLMEYFKMSETGKIYAE